MSGADASLERLAAALAEERRALLEHDVEALMASTQAKLAALRALESHPAEGIATRLAELAEANRANGALLARRRREVNWALRHLGRSESGSEYDARGRADVVRTTRQLAVA
ncbi:flagellar protein FlgN [Luteimonas sp. RD2P54]|uniref:Flagellar protein FlgN n=1 Tax=Luteimonas endophytica TaxID=3042023 RepID=A0ABT6J7M0_9GAMM|nr:flagellar protein FlgN [Luteimonas endophytica]MDH5822739.1 flagellar protein FlgN [Luteimonas endophytica]